MKYCKLYISLNKYIAVVVVVVVVVKYSDSKIIEVKTCRFENFSQKKGSRKFFVTFLG